MKKILFLLIMGIGLPTICFSQEEPIETLNWKQCVQEAILNQPNLLSSKEKYIQAQMAERITASSLFPQVNGSFSGSASESSGRSSENYSYGVSASQLLFDGFKTKNNVEESKRKVLAAEFAYAVDSSNVRLELRQAYIQLLKAQQLIDLTQDIVAMRKQSLDLISLRYDAGKEHKGSLLVSKANLSQAEAEYKQAQRNLEFAQRQLSKNLGRETFRPIHVDGDFTIKDTLQERQDFEELVNTTPFLKELAANVEASAFAVKSAKAEYLPQIYANGSAGSSGDWVPDNDNWSIGFSVSIPIFEGGKKKAQVGKSVSAFTQSKADLRSGKDSMILTLAETWFELQNAVEAVEVQKKFLEAAETRSKISEAQYSNGLISYDDRIIIEDALVDAKKQYLNTKANALLAKANWIQAKGGVLENEEQI